MRQDLSEEEFNHNGMTVPPTILIPPCVITYRLNPHNLLNQVRAHSVLKLHWKYSKTQTTWYSL
jgi:hypothetical protein